MKPPTDHAYVSYDIQKSFDVSPEGPERCRLCGGQLSRSTVEPSRVMQEEVADPEYRLIHGSSWLFVCNSCHWWCVREWYEFIDSKFVHKYGDDYLIVGESKADENSPDRPVRPWLTALTDPGVYAEIQRLPEDFIGLFNKRLPWEEGHKKMSKR